MRVGPEFMIPARTRPIRQLLCWTLLSLSLSAAQAQPRIDEEEKPWEEGQWSPPAQFNLDKVRPFQLEQTTTMQFGIEPSAGLDERFDRRLRFDAEIGGNVAALKIEIDQTHAARSGIGPGKRFGEVGDRGGRPATAGRLDDGEQGT